MTASRALPSAHRIGGVPFVPGEPGACGPASLASVLAYWGHAVSAEAIADALAVPTLSGVLPLDLVRYAERLGGGLMARVETGTMDQLRERVAANHPMVAFLDLGIGPVRKGHFVVVVGYDDSTATVGLYSGRDAHAAMSYRRFAAAWARTGWWVLAIDARTHEAADPSSS